MLLVSAVSIAQISDGCVILSKTLSNKENHPNGWHPNHRLRHRNKFTQRQGVKFQCSIIRILMHNTKIIPHLTKSRQMKRR